MQVLQAAKYMRVGRAQLMRAFSKKSNTPKECLVQEMKKSTDPLCGKSKFNMTPPPLFKLGYCKKPFKPKMTGCPPKKAQADGPLCCDSMGPRAAGCSNPPDRKK